MAKPSVNNGRDSKPKKSYLCLKDSKAQMHLDNAWFYFIKMVALGFHSAMV